MSTITYQNIIVDGFPFTAIKEIHIKHSPNQHATALVVGEISREDGEECVKRTDETTGVLIHTTAKDQNNKLFFGGISNLTMDSGADYCTLRLELISISSRLDIQKKNKSFQNTSKTYEQILNEAVGNNGHVDFAIPDKPIGSIIMQYNETDWEFISRMASKFNAPVLTNIISTKPLITVGLPDSNKSYTLDAVSFHYGVDGSAFQSASQNMSGSVMPEDFAGTNVESYTYGYVGDMVVFNGKSMRIKTVNSVLRDGLLVNYYFLAGSGMSSASRPAKSTSISSAGASSGGFVQREQKNEQASGRMFTGVVQAVKLDKVQVFISDIDKDYDGGGTHWFPYSTAYSSSDGSGWYCMPEVGDTVRVFFPSNNEADAFAASSVNVAPLENPRHKSWRAPGGKEILLTDEGMFIICDKEKIFINLTNEEGISIYSEKDINIMSMGNVYISSDDTVELHAKNQIFMGTPYSYIDIREKEINLVSEQVRLN